jgi:ubiquinone/menaquinone biosynthesis C-methylase UbiE
MDEVELVAAGYDAVYRAYPGSPTLERIWRDGTQESGAEHLNQMSFVTIAELRRLIELLSIPPGATLLDLGCGTGGPGLWLAGKCGAQLIGVDISTVAITRAAESARTLEPSNSAHFRVGKLNGTGLEGGVADAAVSIDALQYAPNKLAVLSEAARLLRPGGRLGLTTFELVPKRAAAVPIYGKDPVPDLRPLLKQAGFAVDSYIETTGWRERVTRIFESVLAEQQQLTAELGADATGALVAEAHLGLSARIYRRRVLATATRRLHQ